MIGFSTQPTGRLGNVLLQYLFMRELADKANTDYFHETLKGTDFFLNLEQTSNYKQLKSKFWNKRTINNQKIIEKGIPWIIDRASNKKNIVLKPAVLGHTFDTLFYDPNLYLKVRPELKKTYFSYDELFVIAIHFRGTDFSSWKPEACLDSQYYIDSINYCLNKYADKLIKFSLFTDDLELDSYKQVTNYLTEKSIPFSAGDPKRNLGTECYNISLSSIVISSPSTFAIAASLIGKPKRVIHSKKWCDFCLNSHDHVWEAMLKSKSPFYDVEALI